MRKAAWTLVIAGGILQVIESAEKASALVNNVQFSQSGIGKLVAPIENFLPISLGWSMLGTGTILLYFC